MKKIKKIIAIVSPILIFALPLIVLAQPPANTSSGAFPNPLGQSTSTFEILIAKIIDNIVVPIGGVIVTFFIIFSGFLFVTAQGNEEKLKTAKTAILWTLIGGLVLLGAAAISEIISGTIADIKSGN